MGRTLPKMTSWPLLCCYPELLAGSCNVHLFSHCKKAIPHIHLLIHPKKVMAHLVLCIAVSSSGHDVRLNDGDEVVADEEEEEGRERLLQRRLELSAAAPVRTLDPTPPIRILIIQLKLPTVPGT